MSWRRSWSAPFPFCICPPLTFAHASLLLSFLAYRFRQKAVELEEELARTRSELSAAKNEAAAAKADNVALVERLRWERLI